MHPCLAIVEVQRAIFRQVHVDGPSAMTNLTLVGLAHTCRSFSDAALDILWEDLDSITYLIQCLPEDLWKIGCICTHKHELLSFQRTMSLTDWEVFRRYASRVRSLSALEGDILLGNDVILALSHSPYNGPLIPRLKVLCWTSSCKNYTSLFPLLFAHTLVDVTLPSFALQPPGTATQFTSTCLLLKSLCIEVTETLNADDRRKLAETITHIHSLESFESICLYRMVDEAAILHLSRLSSLVTLALELNDLHSETLRRALIPPAFASLQSLTLRVDTLTTLTSLLEVMRFQPHEVGFTAREIPTSDDLRLFFNALVDACDQEQLTQIILEAGNEDWLFNHEREPASLSVFYPLFALRNINYFAFDAMCSISLDDEAMQNFADCWPRLARLSINVISGWGMESRVTHRGLVTLLTHCPALEYFALAVDFTEVDRPLTEISPSYGTTKSPCHAADFVSSAIYHPPAIVAFLRAICPKLSQVSSLDHDDTHETSEYSEKWSEVAKSLQA